MYVAAGRSLSLVCAVVAAVFSSSSVAVFIAVACLRIFYNGFFLTAITGLSVLLSSK